MADTSDDARLGTVIAGYRIEERIGRGGMGVVYRAEHLNLRRRAAIKIIAPDLAESSGFRERFTREARIAAALQHPNIVTVYDAGEVDGLLYLAMQYIEGEDLSAILQQDGRLRPYRAIDVCRQVAAALDAAHAMGLIHRDVKPANVLIEGRTAFLTDFGLTKQLEGTQRPDHPRRRRRRHDPLRRAGADRGPQGQRAHGRLLRSAACSTTASPARCRSRTRPTSRSSTRTCRRSRRSCRRCGRDLPEGLDAVVAKALDKSPDRRFPSCGDMISAARAVLDAAGPLGRHVAATPQHRPRPSRPPRRGPRRGRRGAAPARAARRPRRPTRAVARVALGNRVDVLEAPARRPTTAPARSARIS